MDAKVNETELIKARSDYLRGTLAQSLGDELTGALAPDDTQISKFHGFYQQDDRARRQQRRERKLEPYYQFMLRARLPGGVCTPEQWLIIDKIAATLGNGSVRLTTRQSFQYHGVLKRDLKGVISSLNQALIDSLGGCGDVNRNVLCNPNPAQSSLHAQVFAWARRISEHLLPHTQAYVELWLDQKKLAPSKEHEPIYGNTYLPRKFKTAIAIPPHNDVDVYANDLGFIAIAEDGRLQGFNVVAGGGMGATHGDRTTFPRLADDLGFIAPEQALAVAEAVVTTQRDHGDRSDRSHARLKYTIERRGIDWFRAEVQRRAKVRFAASRPIHFDSHGDRYGWVAGGDGHQHLTLFIENGRISDTPDRALRSGLREIATIHRGDFRLTPNQNLIVAGVPEAEQARIERIAATHGLLADNISPVRRNSLACVALPTCPQSMAEAERYLPSLMALIEGLMTTHGLPKTEIVIRMTGCPNGCARPYLAEIGLVGKGPCSYNLFLGGNGVGTRINKLHRENIGEAEILKELDTLLGRYAADCLEEEGFGDFVVRTGIVKRVKNAALDFHK